MRAVIVALLTIFFAFNANAEPIDFFKADGVDYDPAITTPDRFLGHGLGDKPVRHDMMVGYLRSLARQSPRITSETIGFTHEGRPILFFTVTSPENQDRIDEIRQAHKARLAAGAEATDGPSVVWLNYGVHGAESAGMDAAIPTLYHLAAAQGDAIEQTMNETVVVIVAIFNPDGHSRRVNHVYTFLGDASVTDPAHAQHNLWIEARTNHYWFDLNRDWLLLTQPESRAWIKKWHEWKPNVSADFHEMGSNATYYFHPGEPRRKNPLIPDRERELLSQIAKEHAAWLDSEGELYTSEEGFDNFYIGKGSTYPSINGGVGILFEAAAARGGAIETENGVRTYAQNINIHFNTSLTTIEGGRKNREALRAYQKNFFTESARAAKDDNKKAYVFTTSGDEARLDAFLKLLTRHDVSVYALARDATVEGVTYPANRSFIVPLAQPQYTMIKGLFDRVTEFEESVFYDVSGWTLPLAYDLDYASLDGLRYNASLLGEKATGLSLAKRAPEESRYGYIFHWDDYYAPRALYRFLEEDIYARVLMRPKQVRAGGGQQRFAEGAIFVPLSGQTAAPARIFEIAKQAAKEDFVDIAGVESGDAAAGVGDLGSRGSVRSLEKPSILLVFDDGVSRYSAGQIWHLLDHKMSVPVVLRQKRALGSLNLADYTHIVLPGGGGAALSKELQEKVDAWVRQGGVLIATKQAAIWAQDAFLSDAVNEPEKEDAKKEEDDDEETDRFDYADKTIRDAEHVVAGALYESDLDPTHPLGFGHRDRSVATMRAITGVLKTPKDPVATVARYTEAPLLSGYSSQLRLDEIAQTPMLTANRHGQGTIILFADDPAFRATFPGSEKLFMNAIFFATTVQSATIVD
ncbi:MAG: M14 family zinc carboxypeptidase [Pseudomonadota bacterium]